MKKDERFKKYVSKVIDKTKLDKEIGDPEHIKRIAEGMNKWEIYGYEFQLTRDMAEDIKEKFNDGLHRRIEVIYTWKDKVAGHHSYRALLKICSDCEMATSAGVIVSILNEEIDEKKAKKRHDNFLKHFNQSYLNKEITDQGHIRRIAHDLSKWEENCHLFGLSWTSDVSDIHKKFKEEPEKQRIAVINRWIDKNKPDATYGKLLKICAFSEMSSSASTIVDITNEDSSTDEDSPEPPLKKFKHDTEPDNESQQEGKAMEEEFCDDGDSGDEQSYDDSNSGEEECSVEEQPLKLNNCDEIKTPKPKLSNIDYDSFCKRVQYVISTVNDNEFDAASTAIEAPDIEDDSSQITTIDIGIFIGMIGNHAVGIIRHGPGRECADALKKGISKWFPNAKYLVAVGVCYGFSREVTALADVVISEEIVDLGDYRVNDNTITIRGDHTRMMEDVKNIFCCNSKGVEGSQVACDRKAKHFVGKIVSGRNLVDSAILKRKIDFQVQPKAYGGEMEGGELLLLQKKGIEMPDKTNKHMEVIIIKAVVDYADGTKNKDWQYIGARAAFHYVTSKMKLQPVLEKYAKGNAKEKPKAASNSFIEADGPVSGETDPGLPLERVLTINDCHKITMELIQLTQNQLVTLGGALGLLPHTMQGMRNLPGDMVQAWLYGQDNATSPTWLKLITQLRSIGQNGLATRLKNTYGN